MIPRSMKTSGVELPGVGSREVPLIGYRPLQPEVDGHKDQLWKDNEHREADHTQVRANGLLLGVCFFYCYYLFCIQHYIVLWFPKIQSRTTFNIDNNKKCFLSRIIYEGSCDTEDRSNDAENSALITEIHYIFKYSNRKHEIVIIFLNFWVFIVFFIKYM